MQPRKRVMLLNPPQDKSGEAILEREVDLVRISNPDRETLLRAVKGVHGIIARGTKVTAELLAQADVLEVVATPSAGYDHIDIDACSERGIPVVNNAGLNAVSVAEHTIGLMVGLAKAIPLTDHLLRREGWKSRIPYSWEQIGFEIDGRTIGIVGVGNVGSRLAQRVRAAFNMTVLGYDPYVSREKMQEYGATKVEHLDDMLPQVDFLSIHAPHTKETHHIIGAPQLAKMKRTAYLINCARGPLVDEQALVEALRTKAIAGAALDVFEPEPSADDNPLYQMANVIVTPHLAGVTAQATKRMAIGAAEQTLQVLRGERPPRLVNPEVWNQFLERRRA
ncbi:MAG TPA: hydroxyacid dehydrogenase [Alphaproteobacteria bacterium]|nr:hydroxyacid dehydrogenase [Alphaproteobacteria bacterium]